jgi:hypothetical protein
MAMADIEARDNAQVAASFDLTRFADFYADPYPYYRALRDKTSQAHA